MLKLKNYLKIHGFLLTVLKVIQVASRQVLGVLARPFLPYHILVKNNFIDRSNYAYCCLNAAILARKLGIDKISAIEFGCAGGAGLMALEKISAKVKRITGVDIEIFGFDTGEGLPPPVDYRDLPYHWKEGFFKMDKLALESKLKTAKIVYGDVADTVDSFFDKYSPSPIGCIFHDLDFYSSTKASFKILQNCNDNCLPRVYNYFDDIIGSELELYNQYTGELLAISQFNNENKNMKFCEAQHLITRKNSPTWYHQIRILHNFDHKSYNTFISLEEQQLPL